MMFDRNMFPKLHHIRLTDIVTDGPSDLPICYSVSGYNEYETNMTKE